MRGDADHRRPRGDRDRGRDAPRRRQAGRRRDPGLLLRAEARRPGRRLPHVPGRDRGDPETADLLLDPGPRRDGRPHPHRAGQGGAERRRRVPARQPPARLPGLRQRRRMPAAGHHDGLGPGQQPDDRRKAPLREADRALAAGRDRPRALHPLLPLRALQPGGRRGRAAAAARARRPHLRRHLRRPPLHRALPRQHHRPLPGRRADLLHLPLPRPALGHRAGGLGLHALPEPVQRQLHRPRRAGETGGLPRQPRRRRRLALRPRPLRLRDVRRRGAGRPRRAGGAGRSSGATRSRRPPRGCWAGKGACAAIVGDASNEEGYLVQRILREALGSPNVDSRVSGGPGREALVRLAQPELSARVRDIDDADAVLVVGTDPLHSSPILDLRIRKAMRRNGVRLAVATDRPTTLDGGAEAVARYAPGERDSSFLWPSLDRDALVDSATEARRRTPPVAEVLRGAEQRRDRLGRADRPRGRGRDRAPCSTSPRRSTSPARTARGCSRCRSWPTPAACARRAASPTPAPA